MKITLDDGTEISISDLTPAPGADTPPPKADQTAAPAPVTAESRDAAPASPPSRSPVAAKQPQPVKQPKASEGKSSPPGNLLDRQGGVNDILDPQKGNPNVYQFVQPKGEA